LDCDSYEITQKWINGNLFFCENLLSLNPLPSKKFPTLTPHKVNVMSKSNQTLHVEVLKLIEGIDDYLAFKEFISLTLQDNSQVEGKVVEVEHGSAAQLFHDGKGKVFDSPFKMLLNLHIEKAPDSEPVVINFRDIRAWSPMDDYPV